MKRNISVIIISIFSFINKLTCGHRDWFNVKCQKYFNFFNEMRFNSQRSGRMYIFSYLKLGPCRGCFGPISGCLFILLQMTFLTLNHKQICGSVRQSFTFFFYYRIILVFSLAAQSPVCRRRRLSSLRHPLPRTSAPPPPHSREREEELSKALHKEKGSRKKRE